MFTILILSSPDALEYASTSYDAINYALFGIFAILLGSTVIGMVGIAIIRNVVPAVRSRVSHANGVVPGDKGDNDEKEDKGDNAPITDRSRLSRMLRQKSRSQNNVDHQTIVTTV